MHERDCLRNFKWSFIKTLHLLFQNFKPVWNFFRKLMEKSTKTPRKMTQQNLNELEQTILTFFLQVKFYFQFEYQHIAKYLQKTSCINSCFSRFFFQFLSKCSTFFKNGFQRRNFHLPWQNTMQITIALIFFLLRAT